MSSPQSYSGWRTLEKSLRHQCAPESRVPPNVCLRFTDRRAGDDGPHGWMFYFHSHDISQGFVEMMRF